MSESNSLIARTSQSPAARSTTTFAMLAGDVDLAVDADGRSVVVFERAGQTRLLEYLAGLSVQSGHDSAASNEKNHILVDEGRRNVRQGLFKSPEHVRVCHVAAASELNGQ